VSLPFPGNSIAMKKLLVSALAASALFSGAASASLLVNGNLSDWNIDHNTWASSLQGVHYTVEDATGNTNTYLDPGYGGQAYDAEALYATIQDGALWIALITGHDPETVNKPSRNSYGAGDFAIDFGKNGSYELGVNIITGGFGVAGGVYSNPVWAYGLWDANGKEAAKSGEIPDPLHPTSLLGGTLIGTATYDYSKNGAGGYGQWKSDKHFFYEISLDLDLLYEAGWDGGEFNIHWTQNCANDSIIVDPGFSVPEPGSLALLGVGMVGLLGGRLRRRKEC